MEIRKHLQELRDAGNYREIPMDTPKGLMDFSTNDYLGIGSDTAFQERFFADEASKRVPMGSTAARLLAPRQIEYSNLETFLRLAYAKRRGDDTAALLFNSGYHANTGLIPALAKKDTLVVADRLVHASIIDGIVLSRAPFERFRHNDLDHLEEILEKKAADFGRVLVVVESVYSMDGDRADIERLLEIKRKHPNVRLYVDEAHAFGVLGPKGLGLVAGSSAPHEVDVVIGTLGKAAASLGAFAITSRDMRDYIINTSRSFIFSTALPPMQAAWSRYAAGRLFTMDKERDHLRVLGEKLRYILQPYTKEVLPASHIQPLIVGDSKKALDLSNRLFTMYGIKALPIRTPTVPAGTERLRFSLSASMKLEDLDVLEEALEGIFHND